LDCRDSHGADALDNAILSEEPKREVDIVDVAVDENATGELSVRDKEARRVQLIARLRAKDARPTNSAGVDSLPRVAVRSIKAARKSTEDSEIRLRVCGIDYALRLLQSCG
jgi:hypothetical protein